MSIEDKEGNGNNINTNYNQGANVNQQQPQYGNQQQTQTQNQTGTFRSGLEAFFENNRRAGAMDLANNRTNAVLARLTKLHNELIESQRIEAGIHLVRLDRETDGVVISSVLVVRYFTSKNGEAYASYRALLLDAATPTPRVRQHQVQGIGKIEVPVLPQDIYNERYYQQVCRKLRNQKGNPQMKVIDAGAILVPQSLNLEDDLAVTNLLLDSANRAMDMELQVKGEEAFNVDLLKSDNFRLAAKMDISAAPEFDLVGNPIRNDIKVSLSIKPRHQPVDGDFYEQDQLLNYVSGYINLEVAPQVPQQQQYAGYQGFIQPPLLSPVFVITKVGQDLSFVAKTPELWFLALSNAYRATANTAWIRGFLPRTGADSGLTGSKKGIDLRDIGALGYIDPKVNAMLDTKSDSFTEHQFVEMMNKLVSPNLTFSMLVDPLGENAHIERILIDAAVQGAGQSQAREWIVRHVDRLTGNRFSPKIKPEDPLVEFGGIQLLGDYTTSDQEKRPLQDVDTLAALNLTQGNRQEFHNFYATTLQSAQFDTEMRMKDQENQLRQYLDKGLRVRGRGIQLYFTPTMITALESAIREAQVTIDYENMTLVTGTQRLLQNDLVQRFAVNQNAQPTVIAQTGNTGYGYGIGGSMGGRFY